jgi:taurine dioxygenase
MGAAVGVERVEPFGVEVDLDLSKELSGDVGEELKRLLWHEHVLVFRNQDFTFDQQVAVMSLFGPVKRTPGELNKRDYVTKDAKLGAGLGEAGLAFHSDLSNSPLPMIAISLFAMDVEPGTTSTQFVDGTRVYRELPRELQERAEGRDSHHVFPTHSGGYGQDKGRIRSAAPGGPPVDLRLPNTYHPLVMTHPHSGQPILYISEMATDRVTGMSDEESEAFLDELFALTYRPEQIYEHWWNDGDFVVWDNLAVQHGRPDQSATPRRTLRRVVCAEKDMYEQNPQMVSKDGHAVLVELA